LRKTNNSTFETVNILPMIINSGELSVPLYLPVTYCVENKTFTDRLVSYSARLLSCT